jgi:rare lipoprotein A
MKAGTNTRAGFGARCAAVLCVCALAALGGAAPVSAGTGGASTGSSYEAQAGTGFAFSAMRSAGATWYGPGLYGKRTACGQTLRPGTLGVAHRNLPCGTAVKFVFGGRQIVTRVIDRGPFSKGFAWDLTNGAREALGFEGSGQIRYAVAAQYARH